MTDSKQHRKIPILGEIALIPLYLFFVTIHVLFSPFGKHVVATVNLLAFGGFYAFCLLPIPLACGILYVIDDTLGLCDKSRLVSWVVIPFLAIYCLYLLLDSTHLQVVNSGPFPARYWLEDVAWKTADSWISYLPEWECIPWAKDAKLDPTKQYIFGLHPHGVNPFALAAFQIGSSCFHKRFPGFYNTKLSLLAATVIFKVPVVREMFLVMGYIDARRVVASKAVEAGQSLGITPGGEEECILTTNGKDIIVLQKRKGFVRLALSYGVPLVPVFAVGSSDAFKTYPNVLLGTRLFLQKHFGIALPIFHGRWFTPLAYPIPMKLLIGKPITTPKPDVPGAKPDPGLVDEYHQKYIQALRDMHAQHVHDRVLEVR